MKILTIGDSCTDKWIYGTCNRLCPEAPVPVLVPKKTIHNPGMAGNVWKNLVALGADVTFVSNKQTLTKSRYIDEHTHQLIIRVDNNSDKIDRIEGLSDISFDKYDAIVVSDYDKGFLSCSDIENICNRHPKVFVDTKKPLDTFCREALFIKINSNEYNISLAKFGNGLDKTFQHNLIVTLEQKGCRFGNKLFPVEKVEVKNMVGAGDTFLAGLCVKYIETKNIDEAIRFANSRATIVIQKYGVVV